MAILYPIVTEKAISLIELENTLMFVVEKEATKPEIKKEVEQKYGVKVDKVNVQNTMKGKKKAYVKINKAFKADQIAAKLKIA
ncbi:50S ribosomal protein L23 [Candidatus Micrarchaeota archaeon CG1_02_47_40]|nr:MAG: 50S ribosomal protein L23 [Candidatus Micrarchaeota archaeon CG1_02_47_40]